jgi:hypothetical protein
MGLRLLGAKILRRMHYLRFRGCSELVHVPCETGRWLNLER